MTTKTKTQWIYAHPEKPQPWYKWLEVEMCSGRRFEGFAFKFNWEYVQYYRIPKLK